MKKAVNSADTLGCLRTAGLYLLLATLVACMALPAGAATGSFIAHNTPHYVANTKNIGTADTTQTIEVSIWLNPHNRSQLDDLAKQLYDRNSPNYRHWLTHEQFAARFAPTAAEAATVQKFFEGHNLKVVQVGPSNFFVRARGTVGDVESAFHVQLNNYQVNGKTLRANDRDPYVEGDAAALVRSVSGLDTGKYEHPMIARPTNLPVGGSAAVSPAAVTSSSFFSSDCFPGVVKQSFSTNNNGSLPVGTYKGNELNIVTLTSAGCAYTPPPIQTAYNLTSLYAEGYQGQGQTIVIIDWCGSPTIQSDANGFSAKFGLPLLTSSNFSIIYTPTPSLCEAPDATEINIDVEWAHAVAPMANIDLVVPPSASFQDTDEAEFYAVDYGLGSVISGSYGSVESFTPASFLETENLISETAAVLGISTNFSSGDSGDFTTAGIPATVLAPADSPYATAVGGVSLALNSDNSIAWQAGWGNNEVELTSGGFVADPPLAFGFYAGAGGGPSNCAIQDSSGNCLAGYPKPSFQQGIPGIPGKYRQLPDVAWLADPFTGVAILISVPGNIPEQVWQVWGGTSVACPMFSGLWAIANQEAVAAGGTTLGQAAQYLYSMPAGTIFDVVPVGSTSPAQNVAAVIKDSTGTHNYNPSEVLGGATPGEFISALWDYPFSVEDTTLVISFGTDCSADATGFGTLCTAPTSLHTKVGWDNVTGVGTPNGQAFADYFGTVIK